MTSSAVSGRGRSRRALIWSSRKSRSSSVDVGERGVDAGVGGADDRAAAHRDDVEQPPGVVEEGEDPVVAGRREPRDDEVDALRVDDAVLGRAGPTSALRSSTNGPAALTTTRADVVSSSPVSVSRRRHTQRSPTRSARDQLDVVGGRGAGLDRGADEREDEAGVVVDEVGVLVLRCRRAAVLVSMTGSSAFSSLGVEHARAARAEQADGPVGAWHRGRRTTAGRARVAVERGEEGDLLDVVGVGLHQPVARAAEPEHERQLVVLEVLEAAPHEVRRLLAREAAEVAAVDERHRRAAARERRRRDRPVDAGADDEHVEQAAVDPRDVGPPQRHGPSVADRPVAGGEV